MTEKEVDRYRILREIEEKKLTQHQAAELLFLSERQVRNLLVRVRSQGAESIRAHVGKLAHAERYAGFGPTLFTEKL